MRLNIIKILLSSLVVFFIGLPMTSAQGDRKDSKEGKKAGKLYKDLGYGAAIDAYGDKPDGDYALEDLIKIAESHRMNGDYYNAQKWYGQVVRQTDESIYKLYYAQSLQANGHYKIAKDFFLEYDREVSESGNPDRRGAMGVQACDAIQNFRNAKNIKLRNVAELNTGKLDFSPSYVDGGIIFVSTRDNESLSKRKDIWINDNFMELYYTKGNGEGVYTKPIPFSPEINTKYHEGPMTMARDGNTMLFTRNNYNKGKRGRDKDKITMLKIYSASLNSANEWGDVQELAFNADDYHSCHPSLSADGQQLYFASNRGGGFGGMDIYMSELKDGNWSEPVNLGEEVNTKGNEVFPFIHDSGVLYYASNGLPGLGGLDIFTASPLVRNGERAWSNVSNLGLPYNSKKDDFGFIMNEEGIKGYLTSSRPGGKGTDDIYSWESSGELADSEEDNLLVTGTMGVCDAATGKKIAGAKVVAFEDEEELPEVSADNDYVLGLKPSADEGDYVFSIKKEATGASEVFTTDENGIFEYEMKKGKNYLFKVVKSGYADATDSYETQMSSESISHCIRISKRNCVQLKGQVFNAVYKDKTIPAVKVTLLNKCTGELTQVESESDGSYEFCLECGCEYELLGTKANFSKDRQRVSLIKKDDCNETIVQNLKITFGLFDAFANNSGTSSDAQNTGDYMSNNFGGNYDGKMMGRSIILEKLYYDFNKSAIRPDAAQELDKVVQLLREFPSMEIELSSHTDARGADEYNETLSQNRADEAVQYIISRGISASRLSAQGYGEKYTRNRCKNEVDCTEEEHQYNRRTEIKITSFARYNEIKVDYKDNAPAIIDKADPDRKWIWD